MMQWQRGLLTIGNRHEIGEKSGGILEPPLSTQAADEAELRLAVRRVLRRVEHYPIGTAATLPAAAVVE